MSTDIHLSKHEPLLHDFRSSLPKKFLFDFMEQTAHILLMK